MPSTTRHTPSSAEIYWSLLRLNKEYRDDYDLIAEEFDSEDSIDLNLFTEPMEKWGLSRFVDYRRSRLPANVFSSFDSVGIMGPASAEALLSISRSKIGKKIKSFVRSGIDAETSERNEARYACVLIDLKTARVKDLERIKAKITSILRQGSKKSPRQRKVTSMTEVSALLEQHLDALYAEKFGKIPLSDRRSICKALGNGASLRNLNRRLKIILHRVKYIRNFRPNDFDLRRTNTK